MKLQRSFAQQSGPIGCCVLASALSANDFTHSQLAAVHWVFLSYCPRSIQDVADDRTIECSISKMCDFKTLLGRDEIARHATASDCWVVIENEVFDVTKFLEEHPGGKRVILSKAGTDATQAYDAVHSRDLLAKYNAQMYVNTIVLRVS